MLMFPHENNNGLRGLLKLVEVLEDLLIVNAEDSNENDCGDDGD